MRKITKFCEITAQKKGKADGKKEIVFLTGCSANVTKLWGDLNSGDLNSLRFYFIFVPNEKEKR